MPYGRLIRSTVARSPFLRAALVVLALLLLAAQATLAQPMRVDIDATDLPRKLLHARIRIPMSDAIERDGGAVDLWYPKWIPGIHGPRGPVENIAGFIVRDPDGAEIDWIRDPGDVYRVSVDVPAGTEYLDVWLRYICSQPTTNSRGVDSYGSEMIGAINTNTIVVYRGDMVAPETLIRATLRLPAEWEFATALPGGEVNDEGVIEFDEVSLETFIDSPIIAARYLETFDLRAEDAEDEGIVPHWLHIASESESALDVNEELLDKLRDMVTQSHRMFGGQPFDEYHMLVCASDELPGAGLEHLRSSFNVVGRRSFTATSATRGWPAYLLPHEFVHAWCGKYRRPAGMVTPNYHDAKDPELLWVYEGMTQYLGHVLGVRCGLVEPDRYRWDLLQNIRWAMRTTGREWRPLADTARAAHILRGGSANWDRLRRGQDYYTEGALIWLEADSLIRNLTDGEESLDDFCRAFFRHREDRPSPLGFTREEVIETLNDVVEHDWEAFLSERVDRTAGKFALGAVQEIGYRLQYANEVPKEPEGESWHGRGVDARDSVGLRVNTDGTIDEVILGSPADEAGLGPDMRIMGVGEYVWSTDRFFDAIADSVATGTIELLMVSGDKFITKTIEYDGGPRYAVLVRNDDEPDRLAEILAPREKDQE